MSPEATPLAARWGLMGWPAPGHGGTLWKRLLLEAGWAPQLALESPRARDAAWEEALQETRADVVPVLRGNFPILSRWVEALAWIQRLGRGDAVAVMSLHTGAITTHTCVVRRSEWRDDAGNLWNWGWVLAGASGEIIVDASGALLGARGEPLMLVLQQPRLSAEEVASVVARWSGEVDLRGQPPVITIPVVHEELNVEAYERDMAETISKLMAQEAA